jgi:hypothetical protein
MPLKIKRNPCRVNIIIPEYRIEGIIHLHTMMRFSDFMNAALEFIPVTEAKIFSVYDNKLSSQAELVEVRRDQIILIYPEEARSIIEELEEIVESREDYPDKSMESMYVDLTKKQ